MKTPKKERVMKNAQGQWTVYSPLGVAVGPFATRDLARDYARVLFAKPGTGATSMVVTPPQVVAPPNGKTFVFGSLTNPTVVAPKAKLKNKVMFLLDSSGSMQGLTHPAVDSFNSILEAIRTGSQANNQETAVSFYTFGEGGYTPVARKYFDQDVKNVPALSYNQFRPYGSTPMYDAVGQAVNEALKMTVDENTSFIINVITDGQENSSQLFGAEAIRSLLAKVQATDKWTVTFLVPPGNKEHLVRTLGVPEGNVQEWETTARGAAVATQQVTAGYGAYFTSRSAGETFTKGFFTPDLSKVDASQVRKSLTNIAAKVDVLKVPKEMDIQAFVEASGHNYARGKGYYQLTKDEKIQSYKEILLKEKNAPNIYGGKEARDLLGLPSGQNVKVRPGNHGNWDIFIQSTSNNRILVRGTTFLYEK